MASIAQSNRCKLRGFLPLAHRAPRMALWTNRCTRALSLNQAGGTKSRVFAIAGHVKILDT
jgi:hypothetical protein